jgi:hypothetical protein
MNPMNWNLSCRNIRRQLSLRAGNDLEPHECAALERHLAVCPACRQAGEQFQQSQRVIEQVGRAEVPDRESTVWPAVSRHLSSIDRQTLAPSWRDWLPAGAVAAACVSLISLTMPEVRLGGSDMAEYGSPTVILSSPATGPSPDDPRFRQAPLGLHTGPIQGQLQIQPFRLRDEDTPRNF